MDVRWKDSDAERVAFATRSLVVFLLIVALFALLVARMIWLMAFQRTEHLAHSKDNSVQFAPLPPSRGLIFDRHGEILAHNQPVFSLAIVPESVADMDATLADLGRMVEITEAEFAAFRRKLARRRRPLESIPLKFNISEVEWAAVEVNRHRLGGVRIQPEILRHYPYGELMAHAVGSVRRISDEDKKRLDPNRYRATRFLGKRGVEAFYEEVLHGEPGFRTVEVDVRGRERRELSQTRPTAGGNLALHLDARLQIAAGAALGQRRGAVVAMEPSGGILAMVSHPGYEPNLFVTGMDAEHYKELTSSRDTPLLNRATQGRYAPGSTFKPVVALAALAMGLTDWERIIEDRGEFRMGGRVLRDWNWRPGHAGGQGLVDLRRAIYRSSNVYFYELGAKMPVDALPSFAAQFGYGQATALDVADADSGVLPDNDWKMANKGERWYPGDTVNMAIGQGDLLVTPLQLAAVAATIANRGLFVPPRMLRSHDTALAAQQADAGGARPPEQLPRRVEGLTPDDWERMVDAMEDVVHRGGQGYGNNGTAWAHIGRDLPYRLAGKSGTAQVVEVPQGEVYDEDALDEYHRKHAWFIAFAPADAPQIAIAVLVENGGGGSSVAGPVAREVIDAYLLPRLADKTLARGAARQRTGPQRS